MSEAAPEQTAPEAESAPEAEPETFSREYVEELRKENAKYRTKANENSEAAKQAENARLAAMSESERAVAEAEARGRTAAVTEYGKRLATSEIRAAAADSGADLTGVFDYLDLARFVGDDGEPDDKAIKAFVSGLPAKVAGPPSLDGGARSTSTGTDFNQVLRQAAGRA
jgi:hypothetical protein